MQSFTRATLFVACAVIIVAPLACSSDDSGTPDAENRPPASVKTKEELARLAVESLRAGSLEPFDCALPRADDLEAALQSMLREEGEEKYQSAREAMEKGGSLEAAAEEMRRKCQEGFDGILTRVPERIGPIDWSKASFEGMNDEETRLNVKGGVEGGNIHFRVKVGEKTYDFVLVTCMNFDRGWVCGQGIRIKLSMEDAHSGR